MTISVLGIVLCLNGKGNFSFGRLSGVWLGFFSNLFFFFLFPSSICFISYKNVAGENL